MASADRWKDLGFKDRAAYATALTSFALGWVIVFLGLAIVPVGEIDGTVLTCFGIALSYCGGIFGVVLYIKGTKAETFATIMDKVNDVIADKLEKKENSDKE